MNDKTANPFMTSNPLSAPTQAYSVSEINHLVADVLSASLPGSLSVEGEVSNLSVASSGHRYFSLKDAQSTISCALFRGAANRIARELLTTLKNGDKIVVKANLSVYKPRGSYQLIVSDMEPAGFGALAQAFIALKRKLDEAGLTAENRKRDIPTWPQKIAVVTSQTGAAIKDVLVTLARRAPFIPVTVYPTLVQGEQAARNIVAAIDQVNASDKATSVILLVRGGGSLEDLQAFNDEAVAMAVVNSRVPVVSGVGHETDFTIVDFVSDRRAATPTGAAELVSPDREVLGKALQKQQQRLYFCLSQRQETQKKHLLTLIRRLAVQHPNRGLLVKSQQVDEYTLRLLRAVDTRWRSAGGQISALRRQLLGQSPGQKLRQAQIELANLKRRLSRVIQITKDSACQDLVKQSERLRYYQENVVTYRQQLKGLEARLLLLSPLGILDRGYAIVFDDEGSVVRCAKNVQVGEKIHIRLAKGELQAETMSSSKS